MVFTAPYDILDLVDSLFYGFPNNNAKPPIEKFPVFGDDNVLKGFKIQMAVAGFSEENIKVWFDEEAKVVVVEGSNEDLDIASKFKSSFKREFRCSNKIDLSNIEVSLKNGLLEIYFPVIEPKKKKTFLFGK